MAEGPSRRPPRPARPAAGTPAPGMPIRPERRGAPRPVIPEDVVIDLPREVKRELRQHVRTRELGDDVAKAVVLGSEAIDQDVPEQGVPFLEWAKSVAPRAPVIREILGVTRYLLEDYRGALNELRAYKRLSGNRDQDHVVADAMRATGASAADVGVLVKALFADADVEAERRIEGLLVWAGAVADGGDAAAARAVLRMADQRLLSEAGEDARARFTWLDADLAEQTGDLALARDLFGRVAMLEDDPFEAGPRMAALDQRLNQPG